MNCFSCTFSNSLARKTGLYNKETKEVSNALNEVNTEEVGAKNSSPADALEELNSKEGIGLELVGLLHEIMIRSGSYLKLDVQQNIFLETHNYPINIRKPLSLRETKKQDTNLIKLNFAKASSNKGYRSILRGVQ